MRHSLASMALYEFQFEKWKYIVQFFFVKPEIFVDVPVIIGTNINYLAIAESLIFNNNNNLFFSCK